MKIKRNDQVVVITGKFASSTPHRVTTVVEGGERIIVEGVNLVFKHVKKGHPKSPQGGRLRMEMPIQTSNVMFFCDKCGRGRRLGYRVTPEGVKERHCKKCGTTVSQVGRPRKSRVVKAKAL